MRPDLSTCRIEVEARGNNAESRAVYIGMHLGSGTAARRRAAQPSPPPRPFSILVRHFYSQFFNDEAFSSNADGTANVGPIIGLLAAPGAFFAMMLGPLMVRGWDLVMFRYVFISLSMVVMGFTVVLKWDALFPNRRDYTILSPLPLRPSVVFAAKMSALAMFLGVFLAGANVLATLLSPSVDSLGGIPQLYVVHAVTVTAAGLFTALAAASIQGLLVLALPPRLLRPVSTTIQTLLLALFIALLLLTFVIGRSPRYLVPENSALLWFPGFWFIGLYEMLRPATQSAELAALGRTAMQGLGWAAAAFALTWIPAYRHHARKHLDVPQGKSGARADRRAVLAALLHRFVLRNGIERAVFHFITQTIARSAKHRVFLAVYSGFGAAVAILGSVFGDSGLLRLPLILSFVMVSGLRAAFQFPSDLRANWPFQITDRGSAADYISAMRKWIVLCALVPLFLLLVPAGIARFGWSVTLFHVAVAFALSLLLIEIMFFGFRKVPFTCGYSPGRSNLVGLAVIYTWGFTTYSSTMSSVAVWLYGHPVYALLFFAATTATTLYARRLDRRDLESAPALDFEGDPDPAVRTLEIA